MPAFDDQVAPGRAAQRRLARLAERPQLGRDAAGQADPKRIGRRAAHGCWQIRIGLARPEPRRLGLERPLHQLIQVARRRHVGRQAEEHAAQRARGTLLAPSPAIEERRHRRHAVVHGADPPSPGLDRPASFAVLTFVDGTAGDEQFVPLGKEVVVGQ